MPLDARRVERLLELGRLLVGDLDLELVLKRVLEAGRELTGARYAALGILDSGRDRLARFVTVGIDEPTRRELGDLPRGEGVLGVLIHDPRPLRLRSVGDHPRSYGFPLGHPPMESFLGVPVRIGGDVFGNLYLTDKQGAEEFDAADEQTLVALADWAAIAIANARRHGGVRGERDALARAVRVFETTEEIGQALAGETRLERILELIVKRSRALVEARVVVLALREADQLVVAAISGDIDRALLGSVIPLDESLSGDVLRSGRAQRWSDSLPGPPAALLAAFGARTELAVPLQFRGRGLGVLVALDRLSDGPVFSAEDERLITAFASSAATAVATARTATAQGLRRSLEAAERERTHWARELHDQTLQDLAGLKVMISRARRADDREQLDEILDEALEHVQLGVDALRGLVTELRPAALDDLGPVPALQALIDRTAATTGLVIQLELDLAHDEARHSPELESTMYRLVQEALTNVVKHAGASHVTVAVLQSDASVLVHVTDDGVGFDPDVADDGFGLIGMRERVALVGGSLDVGSARGTGTTVTARLPIHGVGEEERAL